MQSQKDGGLYIGYTQNLEQRLKQHNAGKSSSTKLRTPLDYIYIEACQSGVNAKRREEYLKTTQGGRLLKIRLKDFLTTNKILLKN